MSLEPAHLGNKKGNGKQRALSPMSLSSKPKASPVSAPYLFARTDWTARLIIHIMLERADSPSVWPEKARSCGWGLLDTPLKWLLSYAVF